MTIGPVLHGAHTLSGSPSSPSLSLLLFPTPSSPPRVISQQTKTGDPGLFGGEEGRGGRGRGGGGWYSDTTIHTLPHTDGGKGSGGGDKAVQLHNQARTNMLYSTTQCVRAKVDGSAWHGSRRGFLLRVTENTHHQYLDVTRQRETRTGWLPQKNLLLPSLPPSLHPRKTHTSLENLDMCSTVHFR